MTLSFVESAETKKEDEEGEGAERWRKGISTEGGQGVRGSRMQKNKREGEEYAESYQTVKATFEALRLV